MMLVALTLCTKRKRKPTILSARSATTSNILWISLR